MNSQITVEVSYTDGGQTLETLTSAATDIVSDTLGNTTVTGTGLDDLLLVTDTGEVQFNGLAGNDTFGPGPDGGGFDGGDDIDTLDLSSTTQGATVDLAGGTASGADFGTLTLANVENVIGGSGADDITGDAAANSLTGGDGEDTLDGGAGNDTLDGGGDTDTARYSGSSSAVFVNLGLGAAFGAAIGNDQLISIENAIGSDFADALTAAAGGSLLDGGLGNDTLTGDVGDDTLIGGGGDNALDGGAGTDEAQFAQNWADYTITESGGIFTLSDGVTTTTATNIESFVFADVTLAAADLLNVAPTAITLAGDPVSIDENVVAAAIGALAVADGNTADTFVFAVDDSRFEVDGGVLQLAAGESLDFETEPSVQVEVTARDAGGLSTSQTFTIGVNDVNEAPDTGAVQGVWTPGAIEAGAIGADLAAEAIVTDPENNALTYTLISAPVEGRFLVNGVEVVVGVTQLTEAEFQAMVFETGETGGITTAQFAVSDGVNTSALGFSVDVQAGVSLTYSGTSGGDLLDGASGDDVVRGRSGDDTLYGGSGNDGIRGDEGFDTIFAGDGNDTILGGRRSDVIDAGAGDDIIHTRLGSDTVTGGAGADTFAFISGNPANLGSRVTLDITDFESGVDKIDVSTWNFTLITDPSGFTGAGNELWYDEANNRVLVDIDGDGRTDHRIRILNGETLDANDFIL